MDWKVALVLLAGMAGVLLQILAVFYVYKNKNN